MEEILNIINSNKFEVNNYDEFIKSRNKSKYLHFLTEYTKEMLSVNGITTYKVPGHDIGFGISEEGDIVNIFNNSNYSDLGIPLLKAAIKNGGFLVDYFNTEKLNSMFTSCGFVKYEESTWNIDLAPEKWDYKKFGSPSVIYAKLKV